MSCLAGDTKSHTRDSLPPRCRNLFPAFLTPIMTFTFRNITARLSYRVFNTGVDLFLYRPVS